jgi:hypothetical protein
MGKATQVVMDKWEQNAFSSWQHAQGAQGDAKREGTAIAIDHNKRSRVDDSVSSKNATSSENFLITSMRR